MGAEAILLDLKIIPTFIDDELTFRFFILQLKNRLNGVKWIRMIKQLLGTTIRVIFRVMRTFWFVILCLACFSEDDFALLGLNAGMVLLDKLMVKLQWKS